MHTRNMNRCSRTGHGGQEGECGKRERGKGRGEGPRRWQNGAGAHLAQAGTTPLQELRVGRGTRLVDDEMRLVGGERIASALVSLQACLLPGLRARGCALPGIL
jgi:hypothetical protein